jgi:ribonuclease-3
VKIDQNDACRPDTGAAADAKALAGRLGVDFADEGLLLQAVTHSSYTMEHERPRAFCNERLEFLGDAFFDAVIGEALYERLPDEEEGRLTKLRAMIVCEQSLYEIGMQLGIGEVLRLGHGEEMSGGRQRRSLIADAVEAIIGAMYLDRGYETVRRTVLHLFADRIEDAIAGRIVQDYKSAYQEQLQAHGHAEIHYQVVHEEGPDHNKKFYVDVEVNGQVTGHGTGHSKKEAEQAAARDALGSAQGDSLRKAEHVF